MEAMVPVNENVACLTKLLPICLKINSNIRQNRIDCMKSPHQLSAWRYHVIQCLERKQERMVNVLLAYKDVLGITFFVYIHLHATETNKFVNIMSWFR